MQAVSMWCLEGMSGCCTAACTLSAYGHRHRLRACAGCMLLRKVLQYACNICVDALGARAPPQVHRHHLQEARCLLLMWHPSARPRAGLSAGSRRRMAPVRDIIDGLSSAAPPVSGRLCAERPPLRPDSAQPRRPGGIPQLTFVEEYLGEIHRPFRWFEIQVRRCCRRRCCHAGSYADVGAAVGQSTGRLEPPEAGHACESHAKSR